MISLIRISKACKVELQDMLFFDDEHRNIADLERLGVVSIMVKNGMTVKVLMDGLKTFSDRRTSNVWIVMLLLIIVIINKIWYIFVIWF